MKEYQKALHCFDIAIEIDDSYSDAYYNKGFLFINLGNTLTNLRDYQKAIECFDEAININPDDSEYYLSKGIF